MDAFNFSFSLFAIVLGLSLVEVLSGFARALRRRRVVHLGWLVPLLAVFVMLDLTSFWEWAWGARAYLTPKYGLLFVGLVVSGLYYLAASIVFPGEFGERADFDAHYMVHHRQVLAAIMLCDLTTSVPVIVARLSEIPGRLWIEWVVYFGALLTAIASSSKRLNIGALTVLISVYLYTVVMTFVQPVVL